VDSSFLRRFDNRFIDLFRVIVVPGARCGAGSSTSRWAGPARSSEVVLLARSGTPEWLIRWPTSDGSVHDRLHLSRRRRPANLAWLDPVVRAKLT